MKTLFSMMIAAIVCVLLPAPAQGQSTGVVVDRISYCRTFWPICNDRLQPDYHWWEHHGVPDQIQKNTHIGRYNEPARGNVRHLAFFAAGQRWGDGDISLITGQPNYPDFGYTEANRWMTVDDRSLPFRMFNEGIYSRADTFVGLAYDARFNWGFSPANKNDIVDAYYDWLKSKVHANNLRSVYLAGHSRGGALVMRLAQKFKQEFPNVILIVHTFDPVAVMQEGEMGAFNSSIDNPVAGFPRDTAFLNNLGNWSWRSDLRTQYVNKRNYAFTNYLVGGKIFGLAQEVRSLTHQSSTDPQSSLGWYDHMWVDSDENAGGHVGIALTPWIIGDALWRLRDRLDLFRRNMAPLATASASSTYCTFPGEHCYSPSRVNDTDLDSRVGGWYSWTNVANGQPQWLELTWPDAIRTDLVELITSDGYALEGFRIQFWDGNAWREPVQTNMRLGLRNEILLPPIETTRLRVTAMTGPANQPQYFRINEILVRGQWVNPPNQPPTASCSATSLQSGPGWTYADLIGWGNDSDGTIVDYRWSFEDGSTASGPNVQWSFYNPLTYGRSESILLTVTDDDGATGSAACWVYIQGQGCPSGSRDCMIEQIE
jgi:pimeloyl-ACP methyl ester carboxylesterase